MKIKSILFLPVLLVLLGSCNSEPIKLACIGDSITHGSGLAIQSKTAYPVVLDSLLGEDYSVLNFGRSGATMLKDGNLPYWICKEFSNVFAYQPEIVIIKLGTNDTKPRNWNADKYAMDYQSLIDTLKTIANQPQIYLCLPVPVYTSNWGINDSTLTAALIPIIREIAENNNLPVIDLYSQMENQAKNFPDGIHPNEQGAANMAKIVAEEITK